MTVLAGSAVAWLACMPECMHVDIAIAIDIDLDIWNDIDVCMYTGRHACSTYYSRLICRLLILPEADTCMGCTRGSIQDCIAACVVHAYV